jgi:hypothetical protein
MLTDWIIRHELVASEPTRGEAQSALGYPTHIIAASALVV